MRFIEVPDGDLHGKFLLWDADDVIVTSLNWSSADARGDAPNEALRARQSLTPDKLILRKFAPGEMDARVKPAHHTRLVDPPPLAQAKLGARPGP